MQSSLRAILVLCLVFSHTSFNSGWATELSDAQARYQELEKSYLSEMEYLIVFLEHEENQAKSCVAQYELSTVQAEVALRQNCQSDLTRLQSDRVVRTERANSIKQRMDSAAIEIEKLSAGSGASPASSSTGSSSTSPTPTTTTNESSPVQPSESSSPSMPQVPEAEPSAAASPRPSVGVSKAEEKPVASPTPTAKSVTKPVTKKNNKKTIKCFKGKNVKKVTAVKPVCPKGFKVRKK